MLNKHTASMLIFFLLILTSSIFSQTTPGRFIERVLSYKAIDGYILWIPDGFDPSEKWPVIYSLHSGAEVGGAVDIALEHGPASVINWDNSEVTEFIKSRFIVLSPHLKNMPDGTSEWYLYPDDLDELLNLVIDEFSGDEDRVYLTGYSTGGTGTWGYSSRRPDNFAAIMPLCSTVRPSGGLSDVIADYGAFNDLPIWIFQNIFDQVVSYQPVKNVSLALEKENGMDFTRILHRMEDIPGKGDTVLFRDDLQFQGNERLFSSYRIYVHDHGYIYNNIELYQWFLSHSRG